VFLLDTNVVLEILLNQAKAEQVQRFLNATDRELLHVTDVAIFSISIILQRQRKSALWVQFVQTLAVGGFSIVRLSVPDTSGVDTVAQAHNLDFDDTYQYTAAGKHSLTLVSFDRHFDATPLGRRTPEQILNAT
jgi:predicted nucleic acid-binding protein